MTILQPDVIAEAGVRDPRTPAFLSRNQFKCPRCGRLEYGNVDQDRVKMCSLCAMGLCMGKEEKADFRATQEAQPPDPRILRRSRSARICERCGESFRGQSNAQRFCARCQKWAANDRAADRMRKMRKEKSLVTV